MGRSLTLFPELLERAGGGAAISDHEADELESRMSLLEPDLLKRTQA
jgi:hypothetical protein